MNKIIFRTYPRLLIVSVTLFGAYFFGYWAHLSFEFSTKANSIFLYPLTFLFLNFSTGSAIYFFSIKRIKVSNTFIQVSYCFLPVNKKILLSEVKSITQESKEIYLNYDFFNKPTFTQLNTIIKLGNGQKIKLTTVSKLDFKDLENSLRKLRDGNNKFLSLKRTFIDYVLDNLDGIIFTVPMIILIVGMSCEFHGLHKNL